MDEKLNSIWKALNFFEKRSPLGEESSSLTQDNEHHYNTIDCN
jgi:hypothetical protein